MVGTQQVQEIMICKVIIIRKNCNKAECRIAPILDSQVISILFTMLKLLVETTQLS
jgi:hypothetical protein